MDAGQPLHRLVPAIHDARLLVVAGPLDVSSWGVGTAATEPAPSWREAAGVPGAFALVPPKPIQRDGRRCVWAFTSVTAVTARRSAHERVVALPGGALLEAVPDGWGLLLDTGHTETLLTRPWGGATPAR